MKKDFFKNIIICTIIGIILGVISEFALIFNIKFIVKITQSYLFWGIIMVIIAIISKKYKNALINSIIFMLIMNSTYYIIRLIKSGYTNIGNWKMFSFVGIGGSLFIVTLIFVIKDILEKRKNYFRKINLIFMIILGELFMKFNISLGLRFNNLMQYISLGIIVAFVFIIIIEKIYNKIGEL